MAAYTQVSHETVSLNAVAICHVGWVRIGGESLRLLPTAKLPGGTSGYRYDSEPFDRKIALERLSRNIRVESLGEGPLEERR